MNRTVWLYGAAGVAAAILLVLYGWLAYLPLARALAASRAAVAAKQAQLDEARNLLSRVEEFQARAAQVKIETRRLEQELPERPAVPELLKEVTHAATACGIRQFQFVPQALEAQTGYAELPVHLTLTCGYHDLGRFLGRLSQLPRLVNARTIQLTGRDATGLGPSLTAELVLVTYVRTTP